MTVFHGKIPTGSRRKGKTGGAVKRAPDIQRIAKALRGKGTDLRYWVSSATIGRVMDDGSFNITDTTSVYADTQGIIVDVRLEPSGIPTSCRWHGIAAGTWGQLLVPARPGDEVLVLIPDGDMNHAARIALPYGLNATAPIPDNWNQDRMLLNLVQVQLDIQSTSAIRINAPLVSINGRPVAPSTEPI